MCHNSQHDHYHHSKYDTSIYTGAAHMHRHSFVSFTHNITERVYRYLESGTEQYGYYHLYLYPGGRALRHYGDHDDTGQ